VSSKVFTPDPSRIGDDTLMRLGVAAALEFPDGSMSASGLRREAAHGHLQIWRIAGKDYTTRKALGDERTMRPIQPPRLKLRSARKGRQALWVIKDQECEISTGAGESERAKAEIAFANYLLKNRRPSFGDGHPDQVLIGDCLAEYCEKHSPTIARPDGLAIEIERLAEFFGDRVVSEMTEVGDYVDWRCAQTDKRATKSKGRTIKPTTARRKLSRCRRRSTGVSATRSLTVRLL
jgi:hypothetical protein